MFQKFVFCSKLFFYLTKTTKINLLETCFVRFFLIFLSFLKKTHQTFFTLITCLFLHLPKYKNFKKKEEEMIFLEILKK